VATGNASVPAKPTAAWTAAYNAALARGNSAGNAAVAANKTTSNNTAAPATTKPTQSGSLNKPTVGGTTGSTTGSTTTPTTEKPPVDPAIQAQLDQAKRNADALQAQIDVLNAANVRSAADKAANQRNISAQLQEMYNGYGLGTLAPKIIEFIQQGMGSDEVTLALEQTSEYKQRFAANETRRQKGMNVLSPAEYIATERAYRQVMHNAGLPIGFYDSNDDFKKFLENDVSATEVQQRVQAASEAIQNAPAGTLDVFRNWYSTGDLIAYALDPTVAEPLIEKRIKAAEAAAYGQGQGLNITQGAAEDLSKMGYSLQQMQTGMATAATDHATVNMLGNIYGSPVSDDELVKATFGTDAASNEKVSKLRSQERATFGGSGNVSSTGLSRNAGGQL
jgi:hypothetical protein